MCKTFSTENLSLTFAVSWFSDVPDERPLPLNYLKLRRFLTFFVKLVLICYHKKWVFQLRGRERGIRLWTAIPLQRYITRLNLLYYRTLICKSHNWVASNLIKVPQNSKVAPNCKSYQKVAEQIVTKAVISRDWEPCTAFFICVWQQYALLLN